MASWDVRERFNEFNGGRDVGRHWSLGFGWQVWLGTRMEGNKEKVLACSANGEIGYERNDAQKRDTRDTDDEQAKI